MAPLKGINRTVITGGELGLVVAALVCFLPGCIRRSARTVATPMVVAQGAQVEAAADPAAAPASARIFQPATRGDVTAILVERGTVEPVHTADLACRVRNRGANKVASTIKWIVEDGTPVKKGDRLLELDEAELQDQHKQQATVVAEKQALLVQADTVLNVAEVVGKSELRNGQANIQVLEAELKRHHDMGPREKRRLEIKVQQAQQAVDLARMQNKLPPGEARLVQQRAEGDREIAEIDLKNHLDQALAEQRKLEAQLQQAQSALEILTLQAAGAKNQATARQQAARAAVDAERARLNDLTEEIARCRLTAPQDGLALYTVPEQTRFGAGSAIVAVGEPVHEGQKLLRIADLREFQIQTRIHEAMVARLRPDRAGDRAPRGQSATVRIDAYPARTLTGHLRAVASVPSQQDFFAPDVKVYPATVVLDEALPGLKPGMSADVSLVLDERKDVLRIPIQAVVAEAGGRFC